LGKGGHTSRGVLGKLGRAFAVKMNNFSRGAKANQGQWYSKKGGTILSLAGPSVFVGERKVTRKDL